MRPGESADHQARHRRVRAQSLRQQSQALREQADRIEHAGEMWARGAAGEQTIGALLELLRPYGFEVLHDVRWPGRRRANIDHVAIGPPGILVVDAKNWSGSVSVRDGVLQQNGHRRTREVEAARQAGRDVGGQLNLPWGLHIIPVIALAGAGTSGVHRCHDVTVVDHRDLVLWVRSLPAHLSPDDVDKVAGRLRTALASATDPSPRRHRAARRRVPATPREPSAKQRERRARRRRAATREALTKIAVLALLVVAGPSIFAWWSSTGAEVAVKAVIPIPSSSAVPGATTPTGQTFDNCKALRATYPHGVKRHGATNTGAAVRPGVEVKGSVYRANRRLDADGDGLVCERETRAGRRSPYSPG